MTCPKTIKQRREGIYSILRDPNDLELGAVERVTGCTAIMPHSPIFSSLISIGHLMMVLSMGYFCGVTSLRNSMGDLFLRAKDFLFDYEPVNVHTYVTFRPTTYLSKTFSPYMIKALRN